MFPHHPEVLPTEKSQDRGCSHSLRFRGIRYRLISDATAAHYRSAECKDNDHALGMQKQRVQPSLQASFGCRHDCVRPKLELIKRLICLLLDRPLTEGAGSDYSISAS